MGKTAIVFSGQGAQYPGMGKSFYENSPTAKKLYDFAEGVRSGTIAQSFEGTAQELCRTENAQPCLYLVDICAALALMEMGVAADGVAGFSLGEIAALAYAGAYSCEEGFSIVTRRAQYMQEAADAHDTSMAAVLKVDSAAVVKMCADIAQGGEKIFPVNYNSPVQTVVAGSKDAIAQLKPVAKEQGARVVDLAVGAAFHSPYMDDAAEKFAKYLGEVNLAVPSLPVYANYTAAPYEGETIATLSKQMNNPVRWCDTIKRMCADGYTDFIEAGAGKTLCGLIRKIAPEARVYSAENYEALAEIAEAVKNNA